MFAASHDPDHQLLAALREPPPLEQARESLAFWERRRSALPVYRRAARREADEMIRRCRERVAAAERRRYGGGLPGLLRRLLAQDLPSWPDARVSLLRLVWRAVPRRALVVLAALATAWLLTALLVTVALAQLIT